MLFVFDFSVFFALLSWILAVCYKLRGMWLVVGDKSKEFFFVDPHHSFETVVGVCGSGLGGYVLCFFLGGWGGGQGNGKQRYRCCCCYCRCSTCLCCVACVARVAVCVTLELGGRKEEKGEVFGGDSISPIAGHFA